MKKEVSSTKSHLEDTKKSYGDKVSVYARVVTTSDIYVSDLMEIIVDNWGVINESQRHDFARRIQALDLRDTMKLGKNESSEEDEFHW